MGLSGISGLTGLSAICDSTPVVRLAAPANLNADVTGGSAILSWDAVVGAASYEYQINSGAWVANADEDVTVTPGDGTYTFTVRAIDGDGVRGQSATSAPFTVDTMAPTLLSATIDSAGENITLVFSEAVTEGADGHADFALTSDGGAVTMTYVSGLGSATLLYSLSRVVDGAEEVTIDFTQLGDGIQDLFENMLATFVDAEVTNGAGAGGDTILRADGVSQVKRADGTSDIFRP